MWCGVCGCIHTPLSVSCCMVCMMFDVVWCYAICVVLCCVVCVTVWHLCGMVCCGVVCVWCSLLLVSYLSLLSHPPPPISLCAQVLPRCRGPGISVRCHFRPGVGHGIPGPAALGPLQYFSGHQCREEAAGGTGTGTALRYISRL